MIEYDKTAADIVSGTDGETEAGNDGDMSDVSEDTGALTAGLLPNVDDDITAFKQAYPGIRLDRLVASPAFLSFGKHRFGIEPFTEIYRDYAELVKTVESEALAKKVKRGERSTGGGQAAPYTGLSREQSEQLESWNKAYPHLKMTPREFLSK